MIVLHTLSLIFGVAVASAVLGSALKTVVLPQEGFPRLSQFMFALVHRLMVHRREEGQRTSSLRTLYPPVALVSLPMIWMLGTALAFSFIFWGTGSLLWQRAFEISTSSLTTLGFAEPSGTFRITVAFVEATLGLGLVALLISYLPTIYSAYNNRQKGIITLHPIAGTPPTVGNFVRTLHRTGGLAGPEFWRSQSEWIVDAEQTHTAFPILTYFPEPSPDQSWVATLGTVLDSAALVVSVTETRQQAVLGETEKGPLMLLVYAVPAINRIARAADVALPDPTSLVELTTHMTEPAPAVSVSREEYFETVKSVRLLLDISEDHDDEEGWRRFAWLRSGYDLPLRALAGITHAPPAPWTTDRPARVGRPRFLRRRPLAVDWTLDPVPDPSSASTARGG